MKKVLLAILVVTALSVQAAGAKTLEDILKEKGVITEADYKEVTQGFYAQAGYCIIPKTLEVAFRHSYLDPDRDVSNDLQTDIQGAVSYYFNKHNLKLQGDVTNGHIQHAAGPTDDMIYRLQAQVIF